MHDEQIVEVYQSADSVEAHMLRNMLADARVESRLLGEPLNMVGPPASLQSAVLWVRRQDANIARQLLADSKRIRSQSHSETQSAATWKCTSCGEMIEDGFDLCWNCQTPRP